MASLVAKTTDVVITHASWLIQKLLSGSHKEKQIQVETRRVFPAVAFPFTAVVTTDTMQTRDSEHSMISAFREHLDVAIALLHQHPDKAQALLHKHADCFRNIGLEQGRLWDGLIGRAINDFLLDGCFAEALSIPPVSWFLALQLKIRELKSADEETMWSVLRETVRDFSQNCTIADWNAAQARWGIPILNLTR